VIRPGPPWIERGTYPGGIVIQIYTATDPPKLLNTTMVRASDPVEDRADADAALVRRLIDADGAVCLVVYDGDTGERLSERIRTE